MEVPHATVSCCASGTLFSIVPDSNTRRYHECAIDIYQAECAIDSIVLHDDLLHFEELLASRPSASTEACDRAPKETGLSGEYDSCIDIGSCSSAMGSASAIDSDVCNVSINDELEMRTFTIRKIHSSVVKKYVATRGITVDKIRLSIEIVSPSKVRHLIAVPGRNAMKISDWIL